MLLLFDHYWEDQFWRSRLFYMEDLGSWCTDFHRCPAWPLCGGDALTCQHLAVLDSQSPCFSGSHHSPWSLSVLRLIVVSCPGSHMHPGAFTRGSNGHDTMAEKSFRILVFLPVQVKLIIFSQFWALRGGRALIIWPNTNQVEERS